MNAYIVVMPSDDRENCNDRIFFMMLNFYYFMVKCQMCNL